MESPKSKSKSKSKTISKKNKAVATPKTAKPKTASKAKKIPDEAEIRLKAQEIYDQRISSGEYGTAEEDWLKAEKLLKG